MSYEIKVVQKTVRLTTESDSYNYFMYQDNIGKELRDGWILKHSLLNSELLGVLVFERSDYIYNTDEYLNL